MKRTVLVVLLAACQATGVNDYPPGPGGTGPVVVGPGTGGAVDGGIDDAGDAGDAGVVTVHGRLCIVRDLRAPTLCDTTQSASAFAVLLGTRHPDQPPTTTGEFTISAPFGTDLVWQVTRRTFITTVMPYGTDNVIPVVPEALYLDLVRRVTVINPQQGSVVVRALKNGAPAAGVTVTTTLLSGNGNPIPLYGEDNSPVDWSQVGPTQNNGVVWFPGVQVTTTPARVSLKPPAGAAVSVDVSVVDQAITFVTTDIQ
jgi:hypothetical protein